MKPYNVQNFKNDFGEVADVRFLTPQNSGARMIYNEDTGAYYPEIMNIKIAGGRGSGKNIGNGYLEKRWFGCSEMKEAIVDSPKIFLSTKGANEFSGCAKLEKMTILGGVDGAVNMAYNCPMLKNVVLGSVGYPCSNNINNTLFQASGGSAVGDKTVTVYVSDSDTIPFAGEPFGLTGATVIYRSSTTGEVRTE